VESGRGTSSGLRPVDSLTPAHSALWAFASGEFLSQLPKRLKSPQSGEGNLPGRGGEGIVFVYFVVNRALHAINLTHTSKPASAASVTGMPSRAKSRKEMWMPSSRACCTTMMLATLPMMSRLPPKLFASAST